MLDISWSSFHFKIQVLKALFPEKLHYLAQKDLHLLVQCLLIAASLTQLKKQIG